LQRNRSGIFSKSRTSRKAKEQRIDFSIIAFKVRLADCRFFNHRILKTPQTAKQLFRLEKSILSSLAQSAFWENSLAPFVYRKAALQVIVFVANLPGAAIPCNETKCFKLPFGKSELEERERKGDSKHFFFFFKVCVSNPRTTERCCDSAHYF